MIIGYDFEVFRYNFLVVFVDPINREIVPIWDDPITLKKYYESHKDNIYVGYNSKHYDQYLFKGIICGFDAWSLNDWIINKNQPGWKFSKELRKIPMYNYDVMSGNDKSLKQLEGFQGHNIHECSIDFTIDRPLTPEEKQTVEQYCINDVTETLNVFAETKSEFEAITGLIKMFNLLA